MISKEDLGIVVLLVAALWFFDYLPPYNQITAHVAICTKEKCDYKSNTYRKITYKVSFDNQQVVAKPGVFPRRLTNCKVFDAKNWDCDGEMMIDGWLSSADSGIITSETMGRMKWHLARVRQFINSL